MSTIQHLSVIVTLGFIGLIMAISVVLAFVDASESAATSTAAIAPRSEEQRFQSGVEFNNNLASDLSPLLALFGERFAQQFMSFSIGWLDSLVFSMAPLGVITAIVGAIRLGGPSSLRGLIGRARETRAAAEVELMSSTSHEVCELWNGDAIVRVMGSPRIQQFFFFENLPDNYRDGKLTQNPTETKLPIFTMSGALGNVIVKRPKRRSLFNWHITKSKANDDEAGVTEPTKNIAPNISLNLNVEQKAWELYAAVVVGILTQVAVIGIATYTSYSPALQFNKAGLMIQSHSYPMACIGTLLLMTGMFVAASVVQQSTDEEKYELHPDLPKNVKLFVFWIQKGRVINDQNFDSYAIFVNDAVDVVRTSRRHSLEDNSDRNAIQHIQIFTVFGTVAAIAGFVLQFIGLRGLHWSASTAQLAATILMTVVRALLRREITTRPAAVKLEKGFELEWLATKLSEHEGSFKKHFCDHHIAKDFRDGSWCQSKQKVADHSTPTGHLSEPPGDRVVPDAQEETSDTMQSNPEGTALAIIPRHGILVPPAVPPEPAPVAPAAPPFVSAATKLVALRKHVGQLSKWPGPAPEKAVAVADAIEFVLSTLFPSSPSHKFTWDLDVPVGRHRGEAVGGPDPPENEPLSPGNNRIRLTADAVENNKNTVWKVNADHIEALLSLWLRHAHNSNEGPQEPDTDPSKSDKETDWLRNKPRKQSMLLLGADTLPLRRDLKWWVPGGAPELLEVRRNTEVATPDAQSPRTDGNPGTTAPDVEPNSYRIDSHRITGFSGLPQPSQDSDSCKDGPKTIDFECRAVSLDDLWCTSAQNSNAASTAASLGIVTTAGKELLYAQHIFTVFMLAVAKKAEIGGKSEASQETATNRLTAWRNFRLQNSVVAKLALGIQNTGLARSLDEAYLFVIPPLSVESKLPIDAAVDLVVRNLEQHEHLRNWEKANEAYRDMLQVAKKFGTASCPFQLKAIIATAEYLGRRDSHRKHLGSQEEFDVATSLTELFSDAARSSLRMLYQRQNRATHYDKLIAKAGNTEMLNNTIDLDSKTTKKKKNLEEADLSDVYYGAGRHHDEINHSPIPAPDDTARIGEEKDAILVGVGFKELCEMLSTRKECKQNDLQRHGNGQDLVGWSLMHYAIVRNDACVTELIDANAHLNLQDISGFSPMHFAVQQKLSDGRTLLAREADVETCARDGTYPLHWATKSEDRWVEELLKHKARVEVRDNTKRTPLHWAALGGKKDAVVRLLLAGASPKAQDEQQMTPLHLAAIAGDCDCIESLSEGSDVEAKEKSQRTPLMLAVLNDNENDGAVELLLKKKKANIKATDADGRTALHLAAWKGHNSRVALLLNALQSQGSAGKEEAQEETTETRRMTPLHIAASRGHKSTVKLLLDRKANSQAKDSGGNTALSIALSEGHSTVARVLLDAIFGIPGRDEDLPPPFGSETFHLPEVANGPLLSADMLRSYNIDILAKNHDGQTALHLASACGQKGVVATLLDCGVDQNETDSQGRTALHLATLKGREEVVKLLLEQGANLYGVDTHGETALHIASECGHVPIVQLLLEKDQLEADKLEADKLEADTGRSPPKNRVSFIDIQNSSGSTALHLAVRTGNEELTKLLLDWKASATISNGSGNTPLLIVIKHTINDVPLVKILLETGKANTEAKDGDGYTALHHAIRIKNMDIFNLLISNGADVNVLDRSRNSMLHFAVQRSFLDAVKPLIDSRVSITSRNEAGETALHLAVEGSDAAILTALLEAAPCASSECNHDQFCAIPSVDGSTPMHYAFNQDFWSPTIARLLIAHGSPLELENQFGKTPIDYLMKQDPAILVEAMTVMLEVDGTAATVLRLASATGIDTMVARALSKDASIISSPDRRGNTPLHYALTNDRHTTSIRLKVEHQAAVDKPNNNGVTPLHVACDRGCGECIKELLDSKAQADAKDKSGRTPLFMALTQGFRNMRDGAIEELVKLFLEHKVDISAIDNHGWSTRDQAQNRVPGLRLEPTVDSAVSPQTPSTWSTEYSHPNLRVEVIGPEINLSIEPQNPQTFSCVACRADHPFPPQFSSVPVDGDSSENRQYSNAPAYFEISVVRISGDGLVGIGLCHTPFPCFTMMPGWFRDSWGYHGDGGRFFLKSGSPEEPPVVCRLKYGIGDTVGCGVDEEGNLFFTRNGEHLGIAKRGMTGQLFPLVGITARGGQITANFGAKPFRYTPDTTGGEKAEKLRDTVLKEATTEDIQTLPTQDGSQSGGGFRPIESPTDKNVLVLSANAPTVGRSDPERNSETKGDGGRNGLDVADGIAEEPANTPGQEDDFAENEQPKLSSNTISRPSPVGGSPEQDTPEVAGADSGGST